ncbi:hypothetical protein [Rhodoferax sp.]|uniref:hypothetical protein n=1 Tax=Rhodoferax sp. TaxID=50421 RepID=UPI0026046520|nr:hypothetical protein [Rhodoferax sp.]MDD2809374.1 hypothetical protein [Rhodoferax sp.]
MNDESLPCTDLSLFEKEVLFHHPDVALPKNLSDHWLDLIGRDLDVLIGDREPEYDMSLHRGGPVSLVMRLLAGKKGTNSIKIELEKLQTYLIELQVEINLELINRRTDVRTSGATLKTIFENRQVSVSMPSDFKIRK